MGFIPMAALLDSADARAFTTVTNAVCPLAVLLAGLPRRLLGRLPLAFGC